MAAFSLLIGMRLKNIDFTLSLMASSLVLGFTAEKPLSIYTDAALKTFTDPTTFDLFAAVALITLLGYILNETGLMAETIEGLRGILSSRVLLSLIPALFGILTMPGGALMSAPFNEPEADRLKLNSEQKTYMNVWFRHVWFWASPISPTPILAAALAGFTQREFLFAEMPLFAVSVAIGFVASRGFMGKPVEKGSASKDYRIVVKGLAPIAAVISLSLLGLPIWVALTLGIAMILIIKHVSLSAFMGFVRKGIRWDIAIAVVAMLYFRYLIIISGSVNALLSNLLNQGIPLLLILVAVPVAVGVISATPTVGLAMAFPLLVPMCGNMSVYLAGFMYAGIVSGYLASPMHLCLVLTNGYYKSSLGKVYRYLVPSAIALYLATGAYNLLMNGV